MDRISESHLGSLVQKMYSTYIRAEYSEVFYRRAGFQNLEDLLPTRGLPFASVAEIMGVATEGTTCCQADLKSFLRKQSFSEESSI